MQKKLPGDNFSSSLRNDMKHFEKLRLYKYAGKLST